MAGNERFGLGVNRTDEADNRPVSPSAVARNYGAGQSMQVD
jgi:hypothetical protein